MIFNILIIKLYLNHFGWKISVTENGERISEYALEEQTVFYFWCGGQMENLMNTWNLFTHIVFFAIFAEEESYAEAPWCSFSVLHGMELLFATLNEMPQFANVATPDFDLVVRCILKPIIIDNGAIVTSYFS